ncbi:hypothetical protein F5887DRAFT_996978 [Amanita rubescens]|nr:hypothetical protein F5887DRAFT_996978 [Amanita rubescens]
MQSFLAAYLPTVAPPTIMSTSMSAAHRSGHHMSSGHSTQLGGVQATTATTQTTSTGTGTTTTTGTMNTGMTTLMAGKLANSKTPVGMHGTGNGNPTTAQATTTLSPLSAGRASRPGSSLGLGSGFGADFTGTSKSGADMNLKLGITQAVAATAGTHWAMGAATPGPGQGTGKPTPVATPHPVDPVKASVAHLLTKAYSLPCSTAAQAFTHLVQPMARFQLALDALLPLLDAGAVEDGKKRGQPEGMVMEGAQVQLAELPQRILVAYILYSMYAPYPITVNPFKSVLERNSAIRAANEGSVSNSEQLVWVLWKILRGDGNDIGPYTPSTLAKSPLPAKLRASNLILEDALYNAMVDIDDNTYSYFQSHNHQRARSASSDSNHEKNEQRMNTISRTVRMVEEDKHNEKVIHGMKLLLAARDRVLTLSEQRLLIPIIPDLAASQMVASLDLAPLAALNPQITHLLIVSIFNNTAKTVDVELLYPYIDTLSCLPPTRPSFDLMGRLIQDSSPISLTGYSTVADLIRMEVLGRFIHECITWLERAEVEEREGLVSDDRFAQCVQNLCRFFNSLVKLSIVDPTSDVDCAEMAYFSLRHARFEEANALYRTLAAGRL